MLKAPVVVTVVVISFFLLIFSNVGHKKMKGIKDKK